MAWGALTQPVFAQAPLTLRVAQETVAAGAWAQIQVFADQPALITKGSLALDLDPQVFESIERVAVFSANGDATALARVEGTHVEISLASATGGIGQLPDVPVVALRARVLAGARSSGFVSLSLSSDPPLISSFTGNFPLDAWVGPGDRSYLTTLVSGRVSAGATASIDQVSPGGGFRQAGAVLTITGTGFTEATKIVTAGLTFSSLKLISGTRIEATLASSAEVTGTRFRLQDDGSNASDYFASPPSVVTPADPAQPQPVSGMHVVFPFTEQRGAVLSHTRAAAMILHNPTQSAVEVRVYEVAFASEPIGSRRITIAPGATTFFPAAQPLNRYLIASETPLRMLHYLFLRVLGPPQAWDGQVPTIPFFASPNQLTVNYQTGTSAPVPRSVRLYRQNGTFAGASVAVTAGAAWLSASQPDSSGAFAVSVNPGGLAAGTYRGTITGTPDLPPGLGDLSIAKATVQVTLVVSSQPTLQLAPTHVAQPPADTTYHSPVSLAITSNGTPSTFTASVSTNEGGNWLRLDRTSGTTPAVISIQTNPAGLTGGYYSGTVSIAGPSNAAEIQVGLTVYPIAKRPMTITTSLVETREEGTGDPTATLHLSVRDKAGPLSLQVSTDDGGKWLSASVFDQALNAVIMTNIDSAAMPAGTYKGTVTASAGGETAQARVTLNVLPRPRRPVGVSPASLTFHTSVNGESPPQTIEIDSDPPALISFSTSVPVRLKSEFSAQITAPGSFAFSALSSEPGTYKGEITIKNSFGSTSVPVTVEVTGASAREPVLSSVVNGASHRAMALAPGEILTLRGIDIGPQPAGLQLDAQGRISSSVAPDTRVEINGQAAPVLYASPAQWNVIVPYEVADGPTANVRVVTYGAASRTWTLPVESAAPAIFSVSGSGVGQGTVLNQDNTVNSPANPAPAGTIIQIFATGGGQSNPAALTGAVTGPAGGGGNRLPVSVFFADNPGSVVFAGPAPGLVAGVLQVNAVVPPFGRPTENKTLRLALEINGVRSAPVEVTIR